METKPRQFTLTGFKAILVSVAAAIALILAVLQAVIGVLPGQVESLGATNFTNVGIADGVVGEPSLQFYNDTDTGIYRVGSNDIGVAVGGSKIGDFTSSGWTGAIGSSGALSGAYVTATTSSALGVATGTSLQTTGAITAGGTLAVTAASTFNNLMTVNSNVDADSLSVAGNSDLTTINNSGGDITINDNVITTGTLTLSGNVIREITFGVSTTPAQGETIIAHSMGTTPTLCLLTSIGSGAISRTLNYTVGNSTSFYLYSGAGDAGDVAWQCVR